jgi:hypothetical protein
MPSVVSCYHRCLAFRTISGLNRSATAVHAYDIVSAKTIQIQKSVCNATNFVWILSRVDVGLDVLLN